MRRTFAFLGLAMLILSACAPVTAPPTTFTAPLPTTPAPTATATAAPTATPTPTPVPTIQVGALAVPDPRATNPELFDLSRPDAPIPQFVNAMRMAGIKVSGEQVVEALNYELRKSVDGKDYVLAIYTVNDKNGTPYTTGFIAFTNQGGEWEWEIVTPRALGNVKNILVGVEIDPGHPNDHEYGYKNFVYQNINYFVISGALSHQWLRYGKTYTPMMVDEFMRRNPGSKLTLGLGHMFYHHDSFPKELSDNSIPIEKRRELAKKYMRERVKEVLTIVAPLMKKVSYFKCSI